MHEIKSLGTLVSRIVQRLDEGTLELGFEEPIQRGSADGVVRVIDDPGDPGSHMILVRLGIMRVPTHDTTAFYRRLLELNETFKGRAAFCVDSDELVCVQTGRPVEDLDPSEVVDMILWTSELADHYDDVLLEEFDPEPDLP